MTALTKPADALPLGDLNTTPLIDVLLVLLILFVITIPPATHAVEVELPGDGVTVDRTSNTVVLDVGQRILWNGSVVTQPQLAGLLAATRRLPVEPELRFAPEGGASYALAADVLHTIKASGVTGFGFVGNVAYADFAKAPR